MRKRHLGTISVAIGSGFDLEERVPRAELRSTLSELPGLVVVNYAWVRYEEMQRNPLANAVSGMLFAGFWVSLALSLLDFAFYMAETVRRRATTFGVLRALGLACTRLNASPDCRTDRLHYTCVDHWSWFWSRSGVSDPAISGPHRRSDITGACRPDYNTCAATHCELYKHADIDNTNTVARQPECGDAFW